MGNDLGQVKQKVNVAEIVHHGEKMVLPQEMTVEDAIELLKRRRDYLQETVSFNETFDVFPWDGAFALDVVLRRTFGWSPGEPIHTMFGKQPPQMVTIDVDYKKKATVPWGQFSIPGHEGRLATGTSRNKDGRVVFQLTATVLRKSEEVVKRIFAEISKELERNSIYKGKAIKMRFRDDQGDALEMPEPQFMDAKNVDDTFLVYSAPVQAAIETNLFTPITRVKDCVANGITVKRGVLLGGTYGTGKTLAAQVASRYAVENGITYIYVTRADELADAVGFAKQYQSPASVVFCEDIDRVMAGDRSVGMDEVLNIIDGIDSKNNNIIVVLTTNELDSINPAMLRPGRLDAVIEVEAPDGPAVEKLLRIYGGKSVNPKTSLALVGLELAGTIPAVIAEVVKRAKLAQLKLEKPGEKIKELSEQALLEAAQTMTRQRKLLQGKEPVKLATIDDQVQEAVKVALAAERERIERTKNVVDEIRQRVG